MSTRSEVEIRLRASIADAEAKLRKMGSRFDKLKRKANVLGSALGKMGFSFKRATIAGAAMAAGMAIIINRTLSAIDKTAKLSRNIGISTESLAAFHLQAELAGVSTDTMDKSLGKMIKNIGDAALGFGTAKTLLDRLNIDIQKLANLKPEEQFQFMADAIKGMTNRAEKLSFAVAIFGRQGINLIEVLEGGSKAFQAAAKDTELFGTAISEIDAKKVEEFNDQMTILKAVGRGAATTLTIHFAEAMKHTIDNFIDAARESKGFNDELKLLGKNLAGLATTALKAVTIYQKLWEVQSKLLVPFKFWTDLLSENSEKTDEAVEKQERLNEAINEGTTAQEKLNEEFRKRMLVLGKASEGVAQSQGDEAFKKINEQAKRMDRLAREGLTVTKQVRTPQEVLNDTITRLNELRSADVISLETLSRASEKAINDFKKVSGVADEDMKNNLINIEAVAFAVTQNMTDGFEGFFLSAMNGFKGFGGFATSMLNSIQRSIASVFAGLATSSAQLGIKKFFPSIAAAVGFHSGGLVMHEGGYVPRFHSGGLASDERPAILQTGEGVVSRRGMKAFDQLNQLNQGNVGGGSSKQAEEMQVTIFNLIDPGSLVSIGLQDPRAKGIVINHISADTIGRGTTFKTLRGNL